MTTKLTLPSVSLDTSMFEPQRRWEIWQSFNSGLFRLKRHNPPEKEFLAAGNAFRVGNTILGEFSINGHVVQHNAEMYSVEREDQLVLIMHRAGSSKGVLSGQSFEMNSSKLSIFDSNRLLHINTENVDYVSFTFPYATIGYDPARHPCLFHLPVGSPVGRILKSNLELMLHLVPRSAVQDAIALSDGYCGLLKALTARDLSKESMQKRFTLSRAQAIRRFVAENLCDPMLDAEKICMEIGVSRAVLYRIFEAEGGVQRTILKQRLENALNELSHSEPHRGVVARVSQYWAFSDQAHFSRLFRETFGCKPSDFVGTALQHSTHEDTGEHCEGLRFSGAVTPLIELYKIGHNNRAARFSQSEKLPNHETTRIDGCSCRGTGIMQ